jgi:hypothetical protein
MIARPLPAGALVVPGKTGQQATGKGMQAH